jgi:hypothetical protein
VSARLTDDVLATITEKASDHEVVAFPPLVLGLVEELRTRRAWERDLHALTDWKLMGRDQLDRHAHVLRRMAASLRDARPTPGPWRPWKTSSASWTGCGTRSCGPRHPRWSCPPPATGTWRSRRPGAAGPKTR